MNPKTLLKTMGIIALGLALGAFGAKQLKANGVKLY
jgi:hypothetical protein